MKESYALRFVNRGPTIRVPLLLLYLLALIALCVIRLQAQSPSKPATIDGYWQLSAQLPDYDLDTVLRLRTSQDGREVEGVALGPTSGRSGNFAGTISDDDVRLKVSGPMGDMLVSLTLAGDTLSGTWIAGELAGKVTGIRTAARKPDTTYYPKYLRTVCQLLKDNFYDPRLNGVNIDDLGARYAAQLENVRDDGDFVTLIRHMLGEFRTSHLDFFLAPDDALRKERTSAVASWKLSPDIYYINIRHFDVRSVQARQDFTSTIEKALQEAVKSSSLIVDLRGNRGGNAGLALCVLGYLLQPGQNAGFAFGRNGTTAANAISNSASSGAAVLPVVRSSSLTTSEIIRAGAAVIRIDGTQKKLYKGRIVALIDQRCYSASELFAAILRESAGAVLIGTRTAGELLGSNTYTILKNMVVAKKDTGWRLEVPVVEFRAMSGERIEGKGVKPDIEVPPGAGADSVLTEAVRYLERTAARQN